MATAALHERLVFDTAGGAVRDGSRRYVLLRADVLMGIFAALPEGAARDAALAAFARAVETHGADSLRAYAAEPGVDGARLQRVVESAAASLGWGRWSIAGEGAALRLDVRNSPFAAAGAPSARPVCHAIAGMLAALASLVLDGRAAARETACAACGAPRCTFTAALGPGAAASAPPFPDLTQETSR